MTRLAPKNQTMTLAEITDTLRREASRIETTQRLLIEGGMRHAPCEAQLRTMLAFDRAADKLAVYAAEELQRAQSRKERYGR